MMGGLSGLRKYAGHAKVLGEVLGVLSVFIGAIMWLSTVANDAKAAGQEARAAIAAVKELRAELRQDLRGDFGAIQNEIVSLREDATKNKIEVLSRLSVVESRVLQAKEDR